MTEIIYSGSGLGAPEEFIFKVKESKGIPFRPCDKDKILFVTLARDAKTLCGVVTGDDENHIFKSNIENNEFEKIISVKKNAVYYPMVSPSGNRLLFLETPKVSYPPKKDGDAIIRIAEKTQNGWSLLPYKGETMIDPIDWANDDETILYPNREGNLVKENILSGKKEVIAKNVFYPKSSFSGQNIAWYDGKAILVMNNSDTKRFEIQEDAQMVFFSKNDDSKVYYAAPSGFWKMSIFEIDLTNDNRKKIFETAEITFAAIV